MTEKLSTDESRLNEIAHNIATVREKIAHAAVKSGRQAENITLVAVTKTMPASDVDAALRCGIRVFGENRVQELLAKLPQLDMQGRQAHIIGHLQTNKVKSIIGKADMIQSVDSLHLAAEIDAQARKANLCRDILIEVNIGNELSKSGIDAAKLPELLDGISSFSHIRVCGLMAIPPFAQEKELSRPYFAKMHQLFVDIGAKKTDNINMHILSMGMSSDFDIAIEEGSNMVRVGTAIFGKR